MADKAPPPPPKPPQRPPRSPPAKPKMPPTKAPPPPTKAPPPPTKAPPPPTKAPPPPTKAPPPPTKAPPPPTKAPPPPRKKDIPPEEFIESTGRLNDETSNEELEGLHPLVILTYLILFAIVGSMTYLTVSSMEGTFRMYFLLIFTAWIVYLYYGYQKETELLDSLDERGKKEYYQKALEKSYPTAKFLNEESSMGERLVVSGVSILLKKILNYIIGVIIVILVFGSY